MIRERKKTDRILVIKPSSLGDILHVFPALALLHAAWPDAKIDFLVRPEFAAVLDYAPCPIERRILFRRKEMGDLRTFGGEFLKLLRALRRERYDLIIDFQGLFRSAVFAGLARGRVAGFAAPRESAAHFFYHRRIAVNNQLHAVERYVALVNAVTGKNEAPPVGGLPENASGVEEARCLIGTAPECLISLIPGARWESKRFPIALFAQIIRRVHAARREAVFAVLGASGDLVLQEELARMLPPDFPLLGLAGKTSLAGMMEVLRSSRLVLSNDSGPVHAAAALGKMVFGLFGPTDPARTGPYGKQHKIYQLDLECIRCLKRECPIDRISPACHRLDGERIADDILNKLASMEVQK